MNPSAPALPVPARPLEGYFFEDYRAGQHFFHATPRTIGAGDAALYIALTGARQPLFCADTLAQHLGYPHSPIDDLLLFHIAFGKTVPDISYNAVANLGYADCCFLQPVYVGDTIHAESAIVGLKENSSGKTGVVYVRSSAFNQREEKVLSWARWVMIEKRIEKRAEKPPSQGAGQLPNGAGVVAAHSPPPEFPAFVAQEQLSLPAFLRAAPGLARDSGGTRFWADYRPQEVIDHPAGMTIDSSDHTLATKLYQNTARVHFDHLHMARSRFQQRLIYGGHIISICRALSHEGLENALAILAINAGTHRAPTFAGDTIYARSTVIDKWALNEHFGALRIHLDGYKNWAPTPGAAAGPEHWVLSLDYTLLMPRH